MTAAERLAALDDLDPAELCRRAETVLAKLVEVMNAETTLLRAHRYREAGELTAQKTQLAQDYVGFARAVQRRLPVLQEQAPGDIERLLQGHDSLATQMAESLRVIGTARNVTESILSDVSATLGDQGRTTTYDAVGQVSTSPRSSAANGIAINRAL
ncbi:MAG: hypothetical protein P4M09_09705 [Devosia sp.]|nr:hypothetical protein [Devosia sp.]